MGSPASRTGPAESLTHLISRLRSHNILSAVYKRGALISRRKLQREKISYSYFQSLDTGGGDSVQRPSVCFSTYLMYINEACACLKKHALWSCTQGFVPKQPLHHHCCHLPLRAKPSPTRKLPTLPHLLLRPPASAQREAALPGGLRPALLSVSENIHRGFWISKPRRQKDTFHYRT